jgi:hypothetical protein
MMTAEQIKSELAELDARIAQDRVPAYELLQVERRREMLLGELKRLERESDARDNTRSL